MRNTFSLGSVLFFPKRLGGLCEYMHASATYNALTQGQTAKKGLVEHPTPWANHTPSLGLLPIQLFLPHNHCTLHRFIHRHTGSFYCILILLPSSMPNCCPGIPCHYANSSNVLGYMTLPLANSNKSLITDTKLRYSTTISN